MKNRTDPDSSLTTSSWWRSVLHNEIFRIEDEDYYEDNIYFKFSLPLFSKNKQPGKLPCKLPCTLISVEGVQALYQSLNDKIPNIS